MVGWLLFLPFLSTAFYYQILEKVQKFMYSSAGNQGKKTVLHNSKQKVSLLIQWCNYKGKRTSLFKQQNHNETFLALFLICSAVIPLNVYARGLITFLVRVQGRAGFFPSSLEETAMSF